MPNEFAAMRRELVYEVANSHYDGFSLVTVLTGLRQKRSQYLKKG